MTHATHRDLAAATDEPTPPSVFVTFVTSVVLVVAMVWLRMVYFPDRLIPTGFGIPLCIFLWLRDRRFLWITAAAFVIISFVKVFVVLSANAMDSEWHEARWIAFLIQCADVIIIAAIVNLLISSRQHLHRNNALLQANINGLAAGEKEIARQNAELQSQTDALERQSEALRFANGELTRRESVLRSLLDLSRALTVELSKEEMFARICEALRQMVEGAGTATAVLEPDNDHLRVGCHSGFGPGGLVQDRIPRARAFAEQVFSQRRTGCVEDLSLRPDLCVPQPAEGNRMVAVLATPLIVRGKPAGTIEVYSREKRNWTKQEISLIESLAAQTAISLENHTLFEEMEREHSRLHTVLNSVPLTLALCEGDSRLVRLNPAGAAMFNVPPDTYVGTMGAEPRWKAYHDGELLPPSQSPIVRAMRDNAQTELVELELVFPSGRRLTILTTAAPIRNREGNAIGAVASAVDITIQKQLQRELDRRRREAEEASVRKSRFLAAASHDIRTPANAISLMAELIKRTADNPAMAGDIAGMAEELQRSANALVTLVSNVLDVTRFESGNIELHETEFPLESLIHEELQQVQPLAQIKQLAMTVTLTEGVWLVTDRIKLGRVLGNLLGNAIKFCDSGEVLVSTKQTDTGIAISVCDTGIGIDRVHLERIFDEFYQLSDPQRSRGSGLGLTICKRLVEAMGGAIRVESEIGKGSTFTVLLPSTRILQERKKASAV